MELAETWRSATVIAIIPTYQEIDNLPAVIRQLMELPLARLQVLVVDDNSPDGTGELAEKLACHYGKNRIMVVHRNAKEGLGRAYLDGMTRAIEADADFIVQMDADLSHSPEYIPSMLGALTAAQADVVIGSRYVPGATVAGDWPWYRKALSAFANAYVRALLRIEVRDVTAGDKIWRSAALGAIGLENIHSNGYSFQVEMTYRARLRGLKVLEMPIHFAERYAGESKISLQVQLESAAMPFRLRRYVRSQTAREFPAGG